MIIGTPLAHSASLPLKFVQSLLQCKQYTFITQEGPSIPTNRNELFERARFEGEDLLMVDSDMVFKPSDVKTMETLLKNNDIVTGVCVMSFHSYPLSLFFLDEHDTYKPFRNVRGEPFEIDGCGCAFLGISKKVLNDLIEPFTPIEDKKTGQFYGEDISFCKRAKETGYKIICDPSLRIGHIKTEVKYG